MKGLLLTDMELVPSVKKDAHGFITTGLPIGDPTRQNQALILVLHKGELKEYPQIGCGISDMLQDNDPLYWRSLIREQLEMDGQKVNGIRLTLKSIDIDATYY